MVNLELVTLSGSKVKDEIYEVILPTVEGNIAVYQHHMPLVSVLIPGVISVRRKKNDTKVDHFAVSGGILTVGASEIRVLVDEADHADDIVEAEVRTAMRAAEQLRDTAKDKLELDHAQELIDRHSVRLKVAGLRRRNKGI